MYVEGVSVIWLELVGLETLEYLMWKYEVLPAAPCAPVAPCVPMMTGVDL